MKKRIGFILALLVLSSFQWGCINRTVFEAPEYQSQNKEGKKSFGAVPKDKLIEQKRIWIWQGEFWNKK